MMVLALFYHYFVPILLLLLLLLDTAVSNIFNQIVFCIFLHAYFATHGHGYKRKTVHEEMKLRHSKIQKLLVRNNPSQN